MRLRLILSFILVALVAVISLLLIARAGAAQQVRNFMFRGGISGTEGLIVALEEYYEENETWRGAESLLALPGRGEGQGRGAGSGRQRLRLIDPQGIVIFDTTGVSSGDRIPPDELLNATPLHEDDDEEIVGYLLPENAPNFSSADETRLLQRIDQAALSAGLIAVGLAILLGLLLAFQLLRPVRELTAAAASLAKGDLSQRVPVRGRDELTELGKTFNLMADSLQKAEHSRKAITADIAHELRNPLAVQRANLEALQDGIYPLNVENLAPIQQQNLLLTRLVEDLRTLAMADAGQLTLEKRLCDFGALVRRVAERRAPQASAKGIQIRVEKTTNLPAVEVDPDRIEQILGNLLSNAIRHTPENGTIMLATRYIPPGALELTVQDSGPGIPEDQLERVFERFYRADRSRSRDEGGSGLGLAIARQLAEAHGGTLSAANHPAGGAVFRLQLPLRKDYDSK